MKQEIIDWLFIYLGLSKYQRCRKWYGGRWELWYIGICSAHIWLTIPKEKPDNYRQPCSIGPRIAREDW